MALLKEIGDNETWINYIHYNLSEKEAKKYQSYWNYNTQKNIYQTNMALKIYDEKLKDAFQGNDNFLNQYIRLCSDLRHNGLQKTVDEISQYYTNLPGQVGNIYSAAGLNKQILNSIKTAQSSIKAIKTFLAQIIALMENNVAGIEALSIDRQLKEEAISLLPQANKLLVIDEKGLKQRKRLSSGYQNLISLLQNCQLDTTSLISAAKNQKMKAPINSLFKQIHIIGGFVQEALIENVVSIEEIAKKLQGHGYDISYTGDKNTKNGFKVNTSDFSINIDKTQAHIKLTLPNDFNFGLSVKHGVENPKWKTRNIKIKTSSLGAMWSFAEGNNLTSAHRNSFYNLAIAQSKGINLPKKTLNRMYNFVEQSLAAPALGGSLTNGDFAFMLSYNNRIYTIRDILAQQSINQNGKMAGLIFKPRLNQLPNFVKGQNKWVGEKNKKNIEEARIRSLAAIKALNQQQFDVKLRISLI